LVDIAARATAFEVSQAQFAILFSRGDSLVQGEGSKSSPFISLSSWIANSKFRIALFCNVILLLKSGKLFTPARLLFLLLIARHARVVLSLRLAGKSQRTIFNIQLIRGRSSTSSTQPVITLSWLFRGKMQRDSSWLSPLFSGVTLLIAMQTSGDLFPHHNTPALPRLPLQSRESL
jgi:hypothetical protein